MTTTIYKVTTSSVCCISVSKQLWVLVILWFIKLHFVFLLILFIQHTIVPCLYITSSILVSVSTYLHDAISQIPSKGVARLLIIATQLYYI